GEAGSPSDQKSRDELDLGAQAHGLLHLSQRHIDRMPDRMRDHDPSDALALGLADNHQRLGWADMARGKRQLNVAVPYLRSSDRSNHGLGFGQQLAVSRHRHERAILLA